MYLWNSAKEVTVVVEVSHDQALHIRLLMERMNRIARKMF
jgi:hypothetical protein